jgi:hypothetical protein
MAEPELNLSTRTVGQLLNMYRNGTITIDQLVQEIARRAQSGELTGLRQGAGRDGPTWAEIDPFGEVTAAVDGGRIGKEDYRALTDLIGPAPTTARLDEGEER